MPFVPLTLSYPFFFLLLAGPAAPEPAAPPPAAVHVVIDTERAYMGSVRKAQLEYWLVPDKTWVSLRGRVTITRRDLGLRWRLDPATRTYVEETLQPPPAPEKPPAGDDIRSARFDYEPEFDWTVVKGRRTTVAGRECREFSAEGQADFARTSLRFAIGPRVALKTDPDVNQLLAGQAGSAAVSRFLRDAARTRGNGCLMSYEETQEPAIAPTIITRVTISTLEVGPPPAGIFDVPDGFTKAPK